VNVIVFGATGMVGSGVLAECLDDPRVHAVLVLGRTSCGARHPKVRELIRNDFFDYNDVKADFRGHQACFFCLGVSSIGMDEATYHKLTYELTLAAATAMADLGPSFTFCYVSGEGTDSTEAGKLMWARVKGKTENHLMRLPFTAYAFRPGIIQPLKGARPKTGWLRAVYVVMTPFIPLTKLLASTHMTTTVNLGRAMIAVAAGGYSKRVLENVDINRLGARGSNSSERSR
jgi:uncharacterized protein YbjT (DUF2867 family)